MAQVVPTLKFLRKVWFIALPQVEQECRQFLKSIGGSEELVAQSRHLHALIFLCLPIGAQNM
jgi:hypothetical protein